MKPLMQFGQEICSKKFWATVAYGYAVLEGRPPLEHAIVVGAIVALYLIGQTIVERKQPCERSESSPS